METRTIIAYALIVAVVFVAVAAIVIIRKRRPVKVRSRDKWSSLLKD